MAYHPAVFFKRMQGQRVRRHRGIHRGAEVLYGVYEGAVQIENGQIPFHGSKILHFCVSLKDMDIEKHPLEPFLPEGANTLFLGSFPPPRARWSMDFFYPNWINDFWRIMGLIHFSDPRHFELQGAKAFDKDRIVRFAMREGLAFFDTAAKVRRLKGNASDAHLEIVEPSDIGGMLAGMPVCHRLVTTGGKASEELQQILSGACGKEIAPPEIGGHVHLEAFGRGLDWYRMPSTSRAYPLPLEKKAGFYRSLFATSLAKKDIRRRMKGLQQEFTPEQAEEESKAIWSAIESCEAFRNASTVLLYMNIPGEVETRSFIERWKGRKRIAIPLVKGDRLELKEYDAHKLTEGYKGILEPSEDAVTVGVSELELAVVPGVAFARLENGRAARLGRGGGFYDRLLPALECPCIGVCYSYRLVDTVPTEDWDRSLDGVVTGSR